MTEEHFKIAYDRCRASERARARAERIVIITLAIMNAVVLTALFVRLWRAW